MTISETLRSALQESAATYREIGETTGIDHSQLVRFANGERGLAVAAIDKLAEYFGLELRS
jgi:transcriptional regulator with XRE-family HTH domain